MTKRPSMKTLCRVDEPQMVVVHKGVDGDMYPLPPHHTVSAPQLVCARDMMG